MNKFKVGDTIIKVKEGNNKDTVGKSVIITNIGAGRYYFNKNFGPAKNLLIKYTDLNFELVSSLSNNYEIY